MRVSLGAAISPVNEPTRLNIPISTYVTLVSPQTPSDIEFAQSLTIRRVTFSRTEIRSKCPRQRDIGLALLCMSKRMTKRPLMRSRDQNTCRSRPFAGWPDNQSAEYRNRGNPGAGDAVKMKTLVLETQRIPCQGGRRSRGFATSSRNGCGPGRPKLPRPRGQ